MSAAPQEQLDGAADPAVVAMDLDRTLERIAAIQTGRIRIRMSGLNDTGKSTALELLLGGRAGLVRASGAATGTIAELMIAQPDVSPVRDKADGTVFMLTEADALRRARALVEAPADNDQNLEGLSRRGHANSALVSGMVAAAKIFGFGSMHSASVFAAGQLEIGGTAAALVERVVTTVPVPQSEWDLFWARKRVPVFVDRPGPRSGGALEAVVAQENAGQAHVTLALFTPGEARNPSAPGELGAGQEIIVLTRLNEIPDGEPIGPWLTTLEQAVAVLMQRPGMEDRPISVLIAPWAFSSAQMWAEFTGTTGAATWERAERARQIWANVPVDDNSPTKGALVAAVQAAQADGGVRRLRTLIESAATAAPARAIDKVWLAHEVRLGRSQLEILRRPVGVESWTSRQLVLEKRIEADPDLAVALRAAAKLAAAESVYGDEQWTQIRSWFSLDGQWRGNAGALVDVLAGRPFTGYARTALDATQSQFTASADAWLVDLGLPLVSVTLDDDEATTQEAEQNADAAFVAAYAAQAAGFVAGYWKAPRTDEPTFREVARTRHELCLLLSRMLERKILPQVQLSRDVARTLMGGLAQPALGVGAGAGRFRKASKALAAASAEAGVPPVGQ